MPQNIFLFEISMMMVHMTLRVGHSWAQVGLSIDDSDLLRAPSNRYQFQKSCSVTEGNGDTYQSFNVGKEGCMWRHTVQHEMLHALGFLHEMARPDRDDYVVIHWDNIDPIFHNQYHKMNNLTWEDYGEKYDLKSIMHYEGWAFAKVGFHYSGLFSL